jgi:hypothetical protein
LNRDKEPHQADSSMPDAGCNHGKSVETVRGRNLAEVGRAGHFRRRKYMTNALFPVLAIYMPTLEMFLFFVGAAALPVIFVIWMLTWLRSVKDVNPEEVIRDQEKADQEHVAHHSPHPGSHAHDHSRGHHHAHV